MALARWQRTIVDQAGNIRPGAMIEVRREATGNLAALKNNRSGSEGKTNPFSADGNGFAFFYVVGGAYRITATDGEALLGEWRDEAVGTAAETDAPVGITRIHTDAGDAEIMAADQCLIIDKDVGESTTVHIPAAAERNGVDIIIKDGKGDADINNITPSFDGAETCDGLSGDDLKITTKRGVLWMRPKPDGSGYIQIDPLDDTLKALGALDETVGILVQTGEDAFERRTLTGTENEVDVVDGAGAGGNPIISLAPTLILTDKTVTVDTQDQSDDSTKVASTGYVRAAINAVLDGVSSSFDTLAEIASELALKAYASVTLTAGGGLTGGGDLSTNRTFNVGAGTGITVNADDVALAAIADDRIMANVSGGSAAPSANTLTSILDEILGNTRGAIVTRNASAWVKLDPGTSGHFLRSNGAAADISYGAVPGGGDLLAANNLSDVANTTTSRRNIHAVLAGHLYGLTLSNNTTDATNDIDIAVGEAANSTNEYLLRLTSGITKRLDATWAVGTGNGGLDTGSIANTTYHVYLIQRSDTGVVDVLFSASATSPTMPTSYDRFRRIGSIIRAGATILAFSQLGDEFLLSTPVGNTNISNPGTSAVNRTLTTPTGVKTRAIIGQYISSTDTNPVLYLSATDQDDVAPNGIDAFTLSAHQTLSTPNSIGPVIIRTSTASTIRSRVLNSSANTTLRIVTFGWIDTRGRLY